MTRRLPPVDSACPVSATRPSSISPRTTVEIVPPVRPVALTRPTLLIMPAALTRSSTAALVLAWVTRAGPLTALLRRTTNLAHRQARDQ